MLEKLKNYIMEGDFNLARSLYEKSDYEILEHDIHVIAYDTENVATYFFILDLIFHKNEPQLHYIACSLLCNPLVYIPGAYYLAYNHILQAIELDSENLKYKEYLLLFYNIPDKILKREEAVEVAKSILKIEPGNKAANSVITGRYV